MKGLMTALLVLGGVSAQAGSYQQQQQQIQQQQVQQTRYAQVSAGSWRSVEYIDDNPVYYHTNRRAYLVGYDYDYGYRSPHRDGRAWASYSWEGGRSYRGADCQAMRMASRGWFCVGR